MLQSGTIGAWHDPPVTNKPCCERTLLQMNDASEINAPTILISLANRGDSLRNWIPDTPAERIAASLPAAERRPEQIVDLAVLKMCSLG